MPKLCLTQAHSALSLITAVHEAVPSGWHARSGGARGSRWTRRPGRSCSRPATRWAWRGRMLSLSPAPSRTEPLLLTREKLLDVLAAKLGTFHDGVADAREHFLEPGADSTLADWRPARPDWSPGPPWFCRPRLRSRRREPGPPEGRERSTPSDVSVSCAPPPMRLAHEPCYHQIPSKRTAPLSADYSSSP